MREYSRTICLPVSVMLLAVACGGPKSFTAVSADAERGVIHRIKRNVGDDDRRDKLIALEEEVLRLLFQIAKLYVDAGEKIRADAGLSDAETRAVMDACSAERKAGLNDIGKIRMQMRTLASEAEWKAIFPPDDSKK